MFFLLVFDEKNQTSMICQYTLSPKCLQSAENIHKHDSMKIQINPERLRIVNKIRLSSTKSHFLPAASSKTAQKSKFLEQGMHLSSENRKAILTVTWKD